MSSYKQLSNQGPPLLSTGASDSGGKPRPISGAISTGHSHRCSAGAPFPGAAMGKAAGASSFYCSVCKSELCEKKQVMFASLTPYELT